MDPIAKFMMERSRNIQELGSDQKIKELSINWMNMVSAKKYPYNFSALGRPIIQIPQDMVALQEIIWEVRPDVIVETGIAHGGSLIYSAAMLALLDMCDSIESGRLMDPNVVQRKVIGVDIDIRSHNRSAIEAHPLSNRISMIQGSSVDKSIVSEVKSMLGDAQNVLVCLDSNHTHEHVLAELNAYAHMVTRGSYCIVFDTIIEFLPEDMFPDRPWARGNNPKTAIDTWLPDHPEFVIDEDMDKKLQISVAPSGYLKRVK